MFIHLGEIVPGKKNSSCKVPKRRMNLDHVRNRWSCDRAVFHKMWKQTTSGPLMTPAYAICTPTAQRLACMVSRIQQNYRYATCETVINGTELLCSHCFLFSWNLRSGESMFWAAHLRCLCGGELKTSGNNCARSELGGSFSSKQVCSGGNASQHSDWNFIKDFSQDGLALFLPNSWLSEIVWTNKCLLS